MQLNEIVPWGRSFDEYQRMFALSPGDLERRILGCGDGPAAFNAELTRAGGRVTSVDPLYAFSHGVIRRRIEETALEVLAGAERHRDRYCWTGIATLDDLRRVRLAAMDVFLADYEAGRRALRYVAASLPHLPFREDAFDLGLCSHLLFTYSDHLDGAFHLAALRAMLRAAPEVRVFPLLTLDGRPSPHLALVLEVLGAEGHMLSMDRVPYEFQRGANCMLRIQRGGRSASEP